METDTGYCLECKKFCDIVLDLKNCDRICTECGLVLETCNIDEHAEWRTFAADDDNNDKDPNRVGTPVNPLFTTNYGNHLVTVISNNSKKNSVRSSEVLLRSKKLNNPDKAPVRKGCGGGISSIADRMGLVSKVKNRAYEIYNNVEEKKYCRGRKLDAIFAACLFIACRESGLSRSLKEFADALNGGVKRKEINRAIDSIKTQLEFEMATVKPGEFVRRFCSYLGMDNTSMTAVRECLAKAEEFDIRRSPKSILAAIIYMINQLSDEKKKKSLKDVSMAAEVAETTIKKAYKDLYPYAISMIPNWFAMEEDVKKKLSRNL